MGTLADLNRILNAAGGRKRQSRKGSKFVSGKVLSVCSDSRFAEPRCSLQRGRFSCFSLVRKEPKVHQRFANLWTPGTIQSSVERDFAKISGGSCRNRFCLQYGGEKALNRCERVAVQLTQDCCFSKKSYCTTCSQ